MNVKHPINSSSGRFWVNRKNYPSSIRVYDDYNECVYLHVLPASLVPISVSTNYCSLPPYLGPRDGSRNALPCAYSVDSMSDDIGCVDDIDGCTPDISSLCYEGDSQPVTPIRRNDSIPYEVIIAMPAQRRHARSRHDIVSDDESAVFLRRNTCIPSPNHESHDEIGLRCTRRREPIQVQDALQERTSNIFMPFVNYESNDGLISSHEGRRESILLERGTSETIQSTWASTYIGSDLEFETQMENEGMDCIFNGNFLRNLIDIMFGWKRQPPVWEVPSSYENHELYPDVDDSSYSSNSM